MLDRSTTHAVTAIVTGVLLATPTPAATASAETCQGRPATIVGTGPDIQGTIGNDVIVTGASRVTRADAGDDLICVTTYPHENLVVDAGPGDDVVDASVSTTTSVPGYHTDLGSGLDRYIGGPNYDEVHAQDFDDSVAGADIVMVELTAPVAGQPGTYTGSHLRVRSATQDVEIDLTGAVLVGGILAAHISGFSRAEAVAPRATVRGNAKKNYLSAYGCDVQIMGKGGDDHLLGAALASAPFTCNGEATMRGGSGDDYIKGLNGRNRLIGNSGHDEIHGRLMDDLLRGGSGNDNLSSGHGRDKADGERGRDRCKAEQERRCER